MPPVTIRISLASSLIALVVLLSAAILLVNVQAGRRIAEDLSDRYLRETERSVEERLRGFFAPVEDAIGYARAWSRRGVLDPQAADASTAIYLPFLRAHPQVSSIATGDEAGFSWRLGADGEDFLERVVSSDDGTGMGRFRVFDASGTVRRAYEEENAYDARTRPWYADGLRELARAGSASASEVVWSPPFLLNTSSMPGIAAVVPFENRVGELYMVTFNVMLERISEFTATLRPTPHGSAAVLSASGEVVGFPAEGAFSTSQARVDLLQRLHAKRPDEKERLPFLGELGSPLLESLARDLPEIAAGGQRASRRLEVGGATWRVACRPFDLGRGLRLWTAVMIPEDDFLGEVHAQQRKIQLVSLGALLTAALLALALARSFARPLGLLAAQSDKMTALDLTPGEPVVSNLVEVRQLADAQERMRGALDSFSRYVPTPVVRELVKQGAAARLGGEVRHMTLMFSDVRSFTTISESMRPDELTRHMAVYFENLLDLVAAHGGAVDKMIGDAVMSLWGAPVAHADHAARAVRGALACRDWLAEFEVMCRAQGLPVLATGFGLATGDAFVGNMGAPARLNYTALGDVVNLASRLEGASKVYGVPILCAHAVREEAGPGIVWRPLDVIAVKGKTQGVRVHEPVGLEGEVSAEELAFLAEWTAAFEDYLGRRFQAALVRLEALRSRRTSDLALARLLEACRGFLAEPPPPDWDGVARLTTK